MPNSNTDNLLYGVPHSLYTGVARSYLRTQGITYTELPTAHPSFAERIVPTIGRSIIPVLVTPAGDVVQDSLDIIDYFEGSGVPYSAYPEGPQQRVLAILIQYYGSQSMLRHAMHYRWTYRDQQSEFLHDAFATGAGVELADKVMARMNSYLPPLGVTEATIPAIERSFESLLDILEVHFSHHPYLFGGRPSVGDYGLIGPLFAHLGRDPVPSHVMKVRAPRVFRWVERMTAPGLDVPDFPDYGADYVANDRIPETLEPLWQHIAEEIFPELTDKLAFMDQLIANRQPEDGEPVAAKPHQRYVGQVDTSFRGIPVQSGVEPYLIYILRRGDRVLNSCSTGEKERVLAYLKRFGLESALPGDRGYSVDRRNHIEVWER